VRRRLSSCGSETDSRSRADFAFPGGAALRSEAWCTAGSPDVNLNCIRGRVRARVRVRVRIRLRLRVLVRVRVYGLPELGARDRLIGGAQPRRDRPRRRPDRPREHLDLRGRLIGAVHR
jgi:hypothetical protein